MFLKALFFQNNEENREVLECQNIYRLMLKWFGVSVKKRKYSIMKYKYNMVRLTKMYYMVMQYCDASSVPLYLITFLVHTSLNGNISYRTLIVQEDNLQKCWCYSMIFFLAESTIVYFRLMCVCSPTFLISNSISCYFE